jgi:hypothetical protein
MGSGAATLVWLCSAAAPQDGAGEAGRAAFLEWLGFEPPASAELSVIETLWHDARTPRSPADGQGRQFLVPDAEGRDRPRAGGPVRVELGFEAGPLGVALGGALYLQAPPFWGWSTPQTAVPEGLGYTTVQTDAAGVVLSAQAIDSQLLRIEIGGRALRAGEQVRLVYGAGPALARADRFAEAAAHFHLALDGDGDGVRELLAGSVSIPVAPGPPARLVVHLPGTARPGEELAATVALLDGQGNARPNFAGRVQLDGLPAGQDPLELRFEPGDGAQRRVIFAAPETATVRLTARVLADDGAVLLEAESNPCRVSAARRVLFGDLQGHSALSDGSGEPDDYFRYARDVAGLDLVALTDHDHWGLRPLDRHPELWAQLLASADAHHEPGRFLALPGFEWTSWIFGHRHVVHFGAHRPLLSSFDRQYDEPQELWAALGGHPSLSIPHTLAGGPVAVDMGRAPDVEVEPVVELVSVHGASDAPDSPRRIYAAREGHWFDQVLERGYEYGVIGSTDGHDGHPGLAHLVAPCGGVAGILAEELTAEAVLAALRARTCFATSGPRILVRTNLLGAPMGAALAAAELGPEPQLVLEVFGTAPLERIELRGRQGLLYALDGEGERDFRGLLPVPPCAPGERLWVRVLQTDRHLAWTSAYRFH